MRTPRKVCDLAKRYTEAWCSRDAAAVAACYSPNGTLTINDGTPARGRKAIAKVAQGFMDAFPDLKVTMEHFWQGNDLLSMYYLWRLDGTNTGPGGTGQRVSIAGSEEWRISENWLITFSKGRFHEEDYKQQLEYGFEEVERRREFRKKSRVSS